MLNKSILDKHSEKIKDLLREGKTQKQIAKIIGCNKDTVGRWMRNKKIKSHLLGLKI
jgi:DNA-binding CsgD family transcriptional regulator